MEQVNIADNYMEATSKASMIACLKAVPVDGGKTVIDAINANGDLLARYKLGCPKHSTPADYETHLRKLVTAVNKTSADVWR